MSRHEVMTTSKVITRITNVTYSWEERLNCTCTYYRLCEILHAYNDFDTGILSLLFFKL